MTTTRCIVTQKSAYSNELTPVRITTNKQDEVTSSPNLEKYILFVTNISHCHEYNIIIPLKTKINVNYIKKFSSYRAVNTPFPGFKSESVKAVKKVVLLLKNNCKRINKLHGQNVEYLNYQPDGT
jgi:hypothetical protein